MEGRNEWGGHPEGKERQAEGFFFYDRKREWGDKKKVNSLRISSGREAPDSGRSGPETEAGPRV